MSGSQAATDVIHIPFRLAALCKRVHCAASRPELMFSNFSSARVCSYIQSSYEQLEISEPTDYKTDVLITQLNVRNKCACRFQLLFDCYHA